MTSAESRVLRIALVSHGATDALRTARFPADEPLNAVGLRDCARAEPMSAPRIRIAPELRATQTAAALGLSGELDPTLTDLDYGTWRGLTMEDLAPEYLMAWLTDPEYQPPHGESIVELIDRVAGWLRDTVAAQQNTLAITHPAIARAAVLIALDAPPKSFWRIDIPPLSVTRLHHRGSSFTLRSTGYDYPKSTP
ncbi:histidine phosphatase family protein [Antrihabitans spumae]|uniref:Histidine phosphatase family protein n=1 Tax=Antrihabitans spumae TaxID=3373370 RepID=A0ABW7K6L9_9NOCA